MSEINILTNPKVETEKPAFEVKAVEVSKELKEEVKKILPTKGKIEEEKVEVVEMPVEKVIVEKKEITPIEETVKLDLSQFAKDIETFGKTEQYSQLLEELKAGQKFIEEHPLET